LINFRFHLVSLVAVFLALALGIVMGSTVIDRAIVDQLRDQIETVRHNADARFKENQALKGQLDALQGYADETVPFLVGRRLEGVPMAVVGVRGINGDRVRDAVQLLRQAGAELPGMIWIEPTLVDPAAEPRLAQVLGEAVRRGPDLQRAALEALGRRLATGPPLGSSALAPGTPSGDVVVGLGDAGFLSLDPLGGPALEVNSWPEAGSRLLVIDGNEGKLEPEVASVPLVRALAAAGAAVVMAEVFRPADSLAPRGVAVGPVRRDRSLSDKVATVDDLEEARGRAVLALAVEGLGRGRTGHYGEGPAASRQLPDPAEQPR
jgi:copper transport outer membrane protein MctB